MKYRFMVIVFMLLISITAIAQRTIGKKEVQIDFGFGGTVIGLPFYAGIEYGLSPVLSMGIHGGYLLNANQPLIDLDCKFSYHLWHVLELPVDWDIYVGLKTAMQFIFPYSLERINYVILGNIGARYYWDDKWAVNFDLSVGPGGTGTLLGFSRKIITRK